MGCLGQKRARLLVDGAVARHFDGLDGEREAGVDDRAAARHRAHRLVQPCNKPCRFFNRRAWVHINERRIPFHYNCWGERILSNGALNSPMSDTFSPPLTGDAFKEIGTTALRACTHSNWVITGRTG